MYNFWKTLKKFVICTNINQFYVEINTKLTSNRFHSVIQFYNQNLLKGSCKFMYCLGQSKHFPFLHVSQYLTKQVITRPPPVLYLPFTFKLSSSPEKHLNLLTPIISDQHAISPSNIYTVSSKQVILKLVRQKLLSWSHTKLLLLINKEMCSCYKEELTIRSWELRG